MERNYWNQRNRYTDYRDPQDSEPRAVNPSSYRGAYRLDTESEDRNKTMYDGFDRSPDYEERHPAENLSSRRADAFDRGGPQHSNSNYRDHPQHYQGNNYHRDAQRHSARGNQHFGEAHHFEDHDPYGLGNFSSNYSPDPYDGGGGDNYGNMAGSLSYGYDGSGKYDPEEEHRYYNPMSGRHHSYHGNYTSRRPNFYDENDRQRHRDDFRPFDH